MAEPGFEWVPSELLSPEFDASFDGGGGPEVDREGADEAEVFRALSTSKARWIGFERHIENRLFSMAHWWRTQARLAYEIQVGEVHGGGQYGSTESHFPTSLLRCCVERIANRTKLFHVETFWYDWSRPLSVQMT